MAAPIVAGLGALVRDLRPGLTAAQAGGIITATAADRGAPGRDPAYGAGVIDANAPRCGRRRSRSPSRRIPPPRRPPRARACRRRARARGSATAARWAGGRCRSAGRGTAVARGARLVCRGRTTPRGRGGPPGAAPAEGEVDQDRVVPHEGRWALRLRRAVDERGAVAVRARLPGTATRAPPPAPPRGSPSPPGAEPVIEGFREAPRTSARRPSPTRPRAAVPAAAPPRVPPDPHVLAPRGPAPRSARVVAADLRGYGGSSPRLTGRTTRPTPSGRWRARHGAPDGAPRPRAVRRGGARPRRPCAHRMARDHPERVARARCSTSSRPRPSSRRSTRPSRPPTTTGSS